MNTSTMNRTERRSFGMRNRITTSAVITTAIRLPNLRHKSKEKNPRPRYELRLSNKMERTFHSWDEMIAFMQFPAERMPELFSVIFENRGEWVEFTDMEDADTEAEAAMNTPVLYECSVCNTMEQVTPINSIVTNCKCGGQWLLADVSKYANEPLPSQRFERKSYDI